MNLAKHTCSIEFNIFKDVNIHQNDSKCLVSLVHAGQDFMFVHADDFAKTSLSLGAQILSSSIDLPY